jgi:hypothetical protein
MLQIAEALVRRFWLDGHFLLHHVAGDPWVSR